MFDSFISAQKRLAANNYCSKPHRLRAKLSHGGLIIYMITRKTPFIVNPKELRPYLAISHVWSDGTGGGIQGEGRVSQCLFKYFRAIAERSGCSAIWWDTIPIPSGRVARQKSCEANAQQASRRSLPHGCTLPIHRLRLPGLTEFPRVSLSCSHLDPRVPGLPWSGERPRKGKVSVVYRDLHDPSGFTMKNFDKDILATHPVYCSRGPLDSVVLD